MKYFLDLVMLNMSVPKQSPWLKLSQCSRKDNRNSAELEMYEGYSYT